ncbi:MAG: hypothetical protein J6M53_09110 [Bacteroidaceae bacterium]|nr:hypothetical protein [Bacteroidaceae bacterium]
MEADAREAVLYPSQFATEYKSHVIRANASICESNEERCKALRLLLRKLSPGDMGRGTATPSNRCPTPPFFPYASPR